MSLFWTDQLQALFSSSQLVPLSTLCLEEQLNALTRAVFIIFVVLLLLDFRYSVHFLAISLAILIILYYIKRKKMKRIENYTSNIIEPYEPPKKYDAQFVERYAPQGAARKPYHGPGNSYTVENYNDVSPYEADTAGQGPDMNMYKPTDVKKFLTIENGPVVNGVKFEKNLIETPEELYFCNDDVVANGPDDAIAGLNQKLARYDNGIYEHPAMKIAPVVLPPAFALEYWRDNDLIRFPQINSYGGQTDMYLSGYAESSCCGYTEPGTQVEYTNSKPKGTKVVEGYEPDPKIFANSPQAFANSRTGFANASQAFANQGYSGALAPESSRCVQTWPSKPSFPIVSPVPVEDKPFYPSIPVSYAASEAPLPWKESYTIPKYSTVSEEGYSTTESSSQKFANASQAFANQGYSGAKAPESSRCVQTWPSKPSFPIVSPVPVEDKPFYPSIPIGYAASEAYKENYSQDPDPKHVERQIRENFEILPIEPGQVNTSCGYNPSQVSVGLPSNLAAGNCRQDPRMKQYNENMFTQIVTPGVYTRSQVNEPINSNIGISFQQQFEPVTCSRDDKGLTYVQHDPRIIEDSNDLIPPKPVVEKYPNYDDVFDPRFYGAGTSYRSYYDKNVGQPRFYYDDVNSIRMPNYVTRSKVDFLPYADTYGPMQPGMEDGNTNPHFRELVQDSFMRNSLQFRNDLMERRMRPANQRAWQQRQAPLGPHLISK